MGITFYISWIKYLHKRECQQGLIVRWMMCGNNKNNNSVFLQPRCLFDYTQPFYWGTSIAGLGWVIHLILSNLISRLNHSSTFIQQYSSILREYPNRCRHPKIFELNTKFVNGVELSEMGIMFYISWITYLNQRAYQQGLIVRWLMCGNNQNNNSVFLQPRW